MLLDLTRFFQGCNPSKTLAVGKAEDRQFYIDFSSVRGGKIIQELGRTITRLSPNNPTCLHTLPSFYSHQLSFLKPSYPWVLPRLQLEPKIFSLGVTKK